MFGKISTIKLIEKRRYVMVKGIIIAIVIGIIGYYGSGLLVSGKKSVNINKSKLESVMNYSK